MNQSPIQKIAPTNQINSSPFLNEENQFLDENDDDEGWLEDERQRKPKGKKLKKFKSSY